MPIAFKLYRIINCLLLLYSIVILYFLFKVGQRSFNPYPLEHDIATLEHLVIALIGSANLYILSRIFSKRPPSNNVRYVHLITLAVSNLVLIDRVKNVIELNIFQAEYQADQFDKILFTLLTSICILLLYNLIIQIRIAINLHKQKEKSLNERIDSFGNPQSQ